MKKVAPLRYGVIFKKAFSQPDIFAGFASAVIGIPLEIDVVEVEKSFSPPIGNVDIRFDLFAEDKKNRIIVDIQHVRHDDHYDRFLHYHCAALLEQISHADNYKPTLRIFTIVVLASGDKHKKDVLITDFEPKDLTGKGSGEIPHKIFFLCPKYINENTPVAYGEWLKAINDSLDKTVEETDYKNILIQKIFTLIEDKQISSEERARMKDEFNLNAKLKEEFQDGFHEGIEIATLRTAKAMLNKGLPIELIAEITQLSPELLLTLRENPS